MKRAFLFSLLMLVISLPALAQLNAPAPAVPTPEVGSAAPDFDMPKTANSVGAASLKELQGKKRVLLMFFPGAFTPGCTTEFTEAGQNHDKFTAMNLELIGISRDLQGALNKFKETVGAKNGFVSDPDLVVTTRYGAVSARKTASRYYYLIDESGKIVWKSVSNTLIPTEKLLADLAQVLRSSN